MFANTMALPKLRWRACLTASQVAIPRYELGRALPRTKVIELYAELLERLEVVVEVAHAR